MSTKRALLAVLVASAVMLAVGVGPWVTGSTYALPQAQEPDPGGVTIPYPGRLADDAGQPIADGAYDFTFALYDAETGGEPLWSEVQEGVVVQEGAFNALLGGASGIPTEVLAGGERWLAVGVRGPGEADFTALTPRQRLSGAAPAAPAGPSNGVACPHDHWGETWEGSSGYLHLRNTGTGNEVYLPGVLAGVWGLSGSWVAVHGQSTDNIGVYGQSANHYGGVFESANDNYDVYLGGDIGRLNSDPYNENSQLVLSSNADVVVRLDNDGGENHTFRVKDSGDGNAFRVSEDGYAVCNALWAYNTAGSIGVHGQSTANAGVYGESVTSVGVVAESNSGDIIRGYGSSTSDIEFKVDNDGDVWADQAFHDWGADFADMVAVAGNVAQYEPGDVLEIGPDGLLILAQAPYVTNVAGVYSTQPGFVGGDGDDGSSEGKIPLALVGVVPVKVSAENGPIAPGDLLVTSSTPGHAMRVNNPPPGTILGKALEPLDAGTGVILVLVTLQ